MKIKIILIAAMMLATACSHQPTAPGDPALGISPKEKALYDSGVLSLKQFDDAAAEKDFRELLDQYPTTAYLPRAFYQWGQALEGEKKYSDAADKYKKAAAFYEGAPSANGAQALYRLSICYEALNDDPKSILTLLELRKQSAFLGKQIADTELPARLAGAYARQGNLEQARFYYTEAEAGLRLLRMGKLSADSSIWLPKTLYSMGRMPNLKPAADPASYHLHVSALIEDQSWLIRCAELNVAPWSQKAVDELVRSYENAWNAIDQYAGPKEADRLQAMKARQDDQRAMGAELDSAISQLRLERLPPSPAEPEPKILTEAFVKIDSIAKRLNILLQAPDIQDQPTQEAQKREGLRREGEIK